MIFLAWNILKNDSLFLLFELGVLGTDLVTHKHKIEFHVFN